MTTPRKQATAQLEHKTIKPHVLLIPWWPEEISRTMPAAVWEEIPRPGKRPLLVQTGFSLEEYRISYLLRQADLTESVGDHLTLLGKMARHPDPVKLRLGFTDRGLYHFTEAPSVVEVRHTTSGKVAVADVSFTLRAASTATIKVGPVKGRK